LEQSMGSIPCDFILHCLGCLGDGWHYITTGDALFGGVCNVVVCNVMHPLLHRGRLSWYAILLPTGSASFEAVRQTLVERRM
jgi:hypothetical protein